VVVGVVRPARPQATGVAWQTIAGQRVMPLGESDQSCSAKVTTLVRPE
jgi:hypothetical protein